MTRTLAIVVLLIALLPARARAADDDFDGDGAGDAEDNCYAVPNSQQENTDGDALGDACDGDDDNDGLWDAVDNCPTAFDPEGADRDEDGVGDVCDEDADGDALVDMVELELGLDPGSLDSDGDTIADAEELGLQLNDGAPLDTDDDGVIDALDEDSDGDGRHDNREAGDADLLTPAVDSDGDEVPDYRSFDKPAPQGPVVQTVVVTGMTIADPVPVTPTRVEPMRAIPAAGPADGPTEADAAGSAEADDADPAQGEVGGCSAAGNRPAGVPTALLLLAAAALLRAFSAGRSRRTRARQ